VLGVAGSALCLAPRFSAVGVFLAAIALLLAILAIVGSVQARAANTALPVAGALYSMLVLGASGTIAWKSKTVPQTLRWLRASASAKALAGGKDLQDSSAEARQRVAERLGEVPASGDRQGAVADLGAALQDESAGVRLAAARSLEKLRPEAKDAYGALLSALGDPDRAVADAAAATLESFGTPQLADLPALETALVHPRAPVRRFAMTALTQMELDRKVAIPLYLHALKKAPKDVRTTAAQMLAVLGVGDRHQVFADLVNALGDPDADVRRAVDGALATLGPFEVEDVPFLRECLKARPTSVRTYAIMALGELGAKAKEAVTDLAEALKDEEAPIREAAAVVLGKIGVPAIPVLERLLKSGTTNQQCLALAALGDIGTEAKIAVPDMLNALQDWSPNVRAAAAQALGKMGAEGRVALPALAQAALDGDRDVRRKALHALVIIGPQPFLAAPLIKAFQSDDEEISALAGEVLAKMQRLPTESAPALQAALASRKPGVRGFAARALGTIGPDARDAAAALQGVIHDKNRDVRLAAIEALGKIGPETGTLGALLETVEDGDPAIADTAAEALEAWGGPGAADISVLAKALASNRVRTRLLAIEILAKAGVEARTAVAALSRALTDSDARIRGHAAATLGKIGPRAWAAAPALARVLRDKDIGVRKKAAAALGAMGPQGGASGVSGLVAALQDPGLGDDALQALLKIGSGAVPDLLEAVANKENYQLRMTAIRLLGRLGPRAEAALAPLIALSTSHMYASIREAARAAVERIQSKG
jgi:HEAT repeat protein